MWLTVKVKVSDSVSWFKVTIMFNTFFQSFHFCKNCFLYETCPTKVCFISSLAAAVQNYCLPISCDALAKCLLDRKLAYYILLFKRMKTGSCLHILILTSVWATWVVRVQETCYGEPIAFSAETNIFEKVLCFCFLFFSFLYYFKKIL